MADKAFVRCADYPGIQFVKRLQVLNDKVKQRAEVAAYFERFDEAEPVNLALYREIDRKDLAIELRMRLGDWFRVVQLVQTGGGDDELLSVAWGQIGDYYAERQKWNKAVQYYTSAKNAEALVQCYYVLEEYECLEKLIRIVPEGSVPLLLDIGRKFQSVGMSQQACAAFLKAGEVKAAIDCCVLLNQWKEAVRLAQEHQFPQIEGLLAKYASHLLEKGETLQAIELYRKAQKSTQAATLLAKLAQDVGRTKVDPLRAKKLHVLAAIEVEEMRKRVLDTQLKTMPVSLRLGMTGAQGTAAANTQHMTAAQATAATLDALDGGLDGMASGAHSRSLDNAWKGAEAYHFFMLAQRQLYSGSIADALVTSLKLRSYEPEILEPREVHSLIAVAAYYNRAWGQCSKAFIELESLKGITPKEREQYAELALEIFAHNAPVDPDKITKLTMNCNVSGRNTCVASGRPIPEGASRIYTCRRCGRKMFDECLRAGINHCPLCHAVLMG